MAALGAIGDAGARWTASWSRSTDKPAIRRRATIALAAFDDPRVDDGSAAVPGGP